MTTEEIEAAILSAPTVEALDVLYHQNKDFFSRHTEQREQLLSQIKVLATQEEEELDYE